MAADVNSFLPLAERSVDGAMSISGFPASGSETKNPDSDVTPRDVDDDRGGCASRIDDVTGSDDDEEDGGGPDNKPSDLPFPGYAAKTFLRLEQMTPPRSWCLKLITWPWFERISMAVILLNCVTLGMYQPCNNDLCTTVRCRVLEIFDHCIFAFFALEMTIKVLAMGFIGKETYLADTWNRLDLFIVVAGAVEYAVSTENLNLSAIRTIRVLRPIRAINRIPSLRILVTLLLDTLPMLGNVLLLCFFVFFIFGIIGVQLWSGLLRNRCFLELPPNISTGDFKLPAFYNDSGRDFICSRPEDEGMTKCHHLSHFIYNNTLCNDSADTFSNNSLANQSCVDWNQYYTTCRTSDQNPFHGAISFDNIGLAWVAIFQVISLAGWVNIMYYVQDVHSFWDWIYFVALIIVGAFFMINLCLVVIATQFSETKKREMERMLLERKRFHSSSTLASNSEPGGCYDEMIKYISHLVRKSQRRINRFLRRTAQARRRVTPERAISMTLQPRRKKKKKHETRKGSSSIPCNKDAFHAVASKMAASNFDSPRTVQDSFDGAELGISGDPQRPAFLHVNNASVGFPSVISLFSSNSLPTPPPTLRLCSPPIISHMSSVSSEDFSGKYLLVPLEIVRTNSHQPNVGNAASASERSRRLHAFSRAASLNCEACGGNYLPVVQIEDGRKRNPISRAASMVNESCDNYTPTSNEGTKSRRNSIMRAVSLSTEPVKNYLPVVNKGTGERRNSFLRTASLNSDPCKIYLPVPNDNSKARQSSISRAASFNSEKIYLPVPGENLGSHQISIARISTLNCDSPKSYLALSKDLPGSKKNSINQEVAKDNDPEKICLNISKECTRRNSINRASSLNSSDTTKKYLPVPPDTAKSRRMSVSRAASLSSGQCSNYLSIPQEVQQKRQNSMARMSSLSSEKCSNYLSVPSEAVGKRRPSISRALSLNSRYHDNASLISSGNKLSVLERNLPAKQGISVIRASSFCNEPWAKYLPLPKDVRCRRSSIGRASSLNSGTCDKYEPLSLDRTGRCRSAVMASSNCQMSNDYLSKQTRSMHMVKFYNKEKSPSSMQINCRKTSDGEIKRNSSDEESSEEGSDEDDDDDYDDDESEVQRSHIVHYWSKFRMFIKKMINSKYCQQGILAAILINTLSMGIEYHNQPQILTQILEYSNLLFSCLFAVEMLLKLIADGLFGYIKNGFNVFDGFIVILSLVELMQGGAGGLSVLRTFRLLRILKLVRFLPALRYQLVVMLRTMDNVAMFFALLILFIFIFSILGMNLFGCKFCDVMHAGNETRRVCKRKNFDSLLWAIITVFQILTQEDWHEVLYIGMAKTTPWAALYFIALMTFGNYVLFNLLVAILVEGFSAEAEAEERKKEEEREVGARRKSKIKDINKLEEKGLLLQLYSCKLPDVSVKDETEDIKNNKEKEKIMLGLPSSANINHDELNHDVGGCNPPIITHTAATPMATPQGSPNEVTGGSRDPRNTLSVEHAFSVGFHSSTDSLEKVPSLLSILPGTPKLQRKGNYQKQFSWSTSKSIDSQSALENFSNCTMNDDELSQTSFLVPNLQALQPERCLMLNIPPMPRASPSQISTPNCEKGHSVTLNNQRDMSHHNLSVNTPFSSQNKLPLSRQNSISSHRSDGLSRQNSICTPLPLTPQSSVGSNSLDEYKRNNLLTVNGNGDQDQKEKGNDKEIGTANDETEDNFEDENIFCLRLSRWPNWLNCFGSRTTYSFFLFSPSNRLRSLCVRLTVTKKFDFTILLFIALNCITLAMERPDIPSDSLERHFLNISNYVFTFIFTLEMIIKVIAKGFLLGRHAYIKSGWNIMDGSLVVISIIDIVISLTASHSRHIFGILRVFRLLRTLRPLRVISRAPGLKLVVQTLLSSLRPIGNIVLICCTFFIIFGILGVQLFKGTFYHCEGPDVSDIANKSDCINKGPPYRWINSKYNFDNLGQALMALFVLASKDGWVNIMYTGLDAVGVDQQPRANHNEWCLVYFISFLLLVGFFVLNMFVGVVVENFHKCRESQEQEEKARRETRHAKKLEHKRKKLLQPPYWSHYSKPRLWLHTVIGSKYFDLAIACVIGINVLTMSVEYYDMPKELSFALKIFNFLFTSVFVLEAIAKVIALGLFRYIKDRWNQLDIGIVILSIVGIALEEIKSKFIPINPTIIRVMRVMRIARVLKLLKLARSVRALLDTVMQALPEVGNLGLLFFLLFYIFAALGVELFGRVECSYAHPCEGLDKHAHFHNFGMAFLTLFRVATGDNWNGIMKDTLRDDCDSSEDCAHNCCVSRIIAPVFFVVFVLMAQFVLVNVVVAVLMKHLEESHKHMDEYANLEAEVLQEMEEEEMRNNELRKIHNLATVKDVNDDDKSSTGVTCEKSSDPQSSCHTSVGRQGSLPMNFMFNVCPPSPEKSCGSPVGSIISSHFSCHQQLQLPIIRTESRVFLPDGTEHRTSQSSLSDCLSLKIPNSSLSAAITDTKSRKPPSYMDIAKSPQWMIGSRGQRGLLSRQNAVSQSSTPDSTPRILSPADSHAFTPTTPGGLLPCFSRAFSPQSSICWPQSSQDEPNISRPDLLTPFSASMFQPPSSPGCEKPVCQLQRSSSSVTTRPNPNTLWNDSSVQLRGVQTPVSASISTVGLLMGSHLSRSKSHPRPRSHHDLEDINMFDPYPRQTSNDSSSLTEFKQSSCSRLQQSEEKSDSLTIDSSADDKIILDKAYQSGSSQSQGEESKSSSHKQQNLSVKNENLLLTCSGCSSNTERKFEVNQSIVVNSAILDDHKMSGKTLCSIDRNYDGHSRTTDIQNHPFAVSELLLEEKQPEKSDRCSLLAMHSENGSKNSDERKTLEKAETQAEDPNALFQPLSPLASPVRPNFLSLTTTQAMLDIASPPVKELNAEAMKIAPTSGHQDRISPAMKLASSSLTVATSTPHAQKSPAAYNASSRPASVDGSNVTLGGRSRRCAQIGRMRAISDSDEFLTDDNLR